MENNQPPMTYRSDYQVPAFLVESLELTFKLKKDITTVTAKGRYILNSESEENQTSLVLFGEELELKTIRLDGIELNREEYDVDSKTLTIGTVPASFDLEIVTILYPSQNTSLEGLYQSSGNFCTQCEAEGFRKITYYPDRPDVLTVFTTRIEADKTTCPVLLSNGNLIDQGELPGNNHFAVWHDPYPKPSYLFALVAGQLVCIQDEFTTSSGKIIDLRIYVEERNREKCDHAMRSLKKAMSWDEEVYGLEYDLDIFMLVAVDDFNMGAMENKGLNIFNSKYVLASQETATDQDYLGIEGVIAHEYFHNWTGNRVTCRDWFQLSLKEGLTVFRDQEFSSDMNSRAVQRIDDVRLLKGFQFREDAGPMAHPVRPDAYLEINNFYTATVYNKGAEVIRMMHTLLGASSYRKGIDLYFKRHDGHAVTCDDFVAAMSDASGVDLSQFKRWYSQAGTPQLEIKTDWNEKQQDFQVLVTQKCPDTPGQTGKKPFHIPLAVGLLGMSGHELLTDNPEGTTVLQLQEREQLFVFQDINEKPTLSFLRNFSAPVKVENFQTHQELAFLVEHDSNSYNRWDAATRLISENILSIAQKWQQGHDLHLNELFLKTISSCLKWDDQDASLLALTLQLPSETSLAQEMKVIDPDALHSSRHRVKKELAVKNYGALLHIYNSNQEEGTYSLSPKAMGKRNLKNTALSYLMALDPLPEEVLALCYDQFERATNMTDTIAALSCLAHVDGERRIEALASFYKNWIANPLVLDKWFSIQAMSTLPKTLKSVIELTRCTSFSMSNPNKVRSLIGAFCTGNHVQFHAVNGSGYRFLTDCIIELNAINPQIAARLVSPLITWKRYDEKRQNLMRKELERIAGHDDVSRDVYEIVSKSMQ